MILTCFLHKVSALMRGSNLVLRRFGRSTGFVLFKGPLSVAWYAGAPQGDAGLKCIAYRRYSQRQRVRHTYYGEL